jgi:hypothetical protein
MRLWEIFFLVLALVSLAGCGHVEVGGECVTCINNPVTGEALNYDPAKYGKNKNTNQVAGSNDVTKTVKADTKMETGTIVLSSPVDVDTAFAAIKPEFGFQSPNELKNQYGDKSAEWLQMDAAYGYDVNPGAFYRMRRSVSHTSNGALYTDVVIECYIQKEGRGAKITMTWWRQGVLNGKAFTDSLLKRVEGVLPQ